MNQFPRKGSNDVQELKSLESLNWCCLSFNDYFFQSFLSIFNELFLSKLHLELIFCTHTAALLPLKWKHKTACLPSKRRLLLLILTLRGDVTTSEFVRIIVLAS